jgi:flagellar motility protein MotE (MotC chaperone)
MEEIKNEGERERKRKNEINFSRKQKRMEKLIVIYQL